MNSLKLGVHPVVDNYCTDLKIANSIGFTVFRRWIEWFICGKVIVTDMDVGVTSTKVPAYVKYSHGPKELP